MNDVMDFLTSEEMVVVGGIILIASILALIVFLIERKFYNSKQKKNTKYIKEIAEQMDIDIEKESETDKLTDTDTPKQEALVIPIEEFEKKEELPQVIPIEQFQQTDQEKDSIESIYNEVKEEVEQLQYADIEPNEEEAKEELRKATEELINQEDIDKEEIVDLTKFEAEQEENAIISIDELMQKSNQLYQQNEITQYQEEGNEPISLTDLENRMKNIKTEIDQIIDENHQNLEEPQEFKKPKVVLDDLNTITDNSKAYREDVVFHSSPIISPIFGIEETKNDTKLELENTANYDKLDEEIKKTNKFIATLKELQKKLD